MNVPDVYSDTHVFCSFMACLIEIPSLTEMRGCITASIYKQEWNHSQLRLKQQLETI